MAYQNLFGQYYSNKSNISTGKYQNYDYVCSNADDGNNNSVIIDDSKVELVDPAGNNIASLDLSQVRANPILEHKEGSFILRPYETAVLDGLEYGKTFKKMFFIVPEEIPADYLDDWRRYINVDFTIVYESGFDTKEFNITTVFHEETKEDIVDRINFLFEKLGLKDYVVADVEIVTTINGNEINYFTFTSLKEGYDFLIVDFKAHTIDYNYYFNEEENERVVVDLETDKDTLIYGNTDLTDSSTIYIEENENVEEDLYGSLQSVGITEMEDNVTFQDGTVYNENEGYSRIGSFDDADEPQTEDSAEHYHYEGDYMVSDDNIGGLYGIGEVTEYETEEGYPVFTIKGKEFDIERCRHLEIGALKYPNLAARVWFLVPEYPTGNDAQSCSILLNHVSDSILSFFPVCTRETLPDDMDSSVGESTEEYEYRDYLYEKRELDVCVRKKDEKERRLLSYFKEFMSGFEFGYLDKNNGAISMVVYDLNADECGCGCRWHHLNPHVGLYGYLDHVQMAGKWNKVGQMYGLITEAEDAENSCIKNLANSILLFNPNEFPVKINYFVAS